jgi:hypothetical protein
VRGSCSTAVGVFTAATIAGAERLACGLRRGSACTIENRRPFPLGLLSRMAKEIVLTKAELAALAAVDGTPTQPEMLPEIKSRLIGLYLIERREWPNGPLWRTPRGDRRVRAKK